MGIYEKMYRVVKWKSLNRFYALFKLGRFRPTAMKIKFFCWLAFNF